MANVIFRIEMSEEEAPDIIDALAQGHEAEINGETNPQSKAEYANEVCRQWIINKTLKYRNRQAAAGVVAPSTLTNPDEA